MSDTTQGTGSAAAGATPAASAEPTAAEVLAFDPFQPAAGLPEAAPGTTPTGTQPAADDKTAGVEPGKAPAVTPAAPAAPAAAPATPATPTPAPGAKPLDVTIQEMAATIRQLTEPKPAAAAPQPEPQAPKFNLGIPPQLVAAMNSEDDKERALALHAVVNGVANHVWDAVQHHIVNEVIPGMARIAEAQHAQRTKVQGIYDDFYGTHKTLADEKLRPLIQAVGQSIAQTRAAAGKSVEWSNELRDEIAEAVYTLVPPLRPAAGTPTPQPKPKPFATGGGAPPAVGQPDEFQAVLKAF